MKEFIFISTLVLLHVVLIQADALEKDSKVILKYGSDCHYSCQTCIGPKYYECSSCQGYNSTVISPQNHIDNITYLEIKNLTLVIGECVCNPAKDQYIQYVDEGCTQNRMLESILEIALNAMIFSNLSLAGLNFLTQLKAFFLIDFIELFQFFGNFAMINHKNLIITPSLQEKYLQMNPTFIMNQQNIGFKTILDEDFSIKVFKQEKINTIKYIPSYEQLHATTNNQVKQEDIVTSSVFKQINQLQENNFKLSQSLKEHGGHLTYFALSINFQILILISYSIMVIFLIFHFLVLEQKYMNNSKNKIYPSQSQENQSQENNINKSTFQYESSKYYQLYSYIVCLSLGWFYLCLNEQLIYIQVASLIGEIEPKSQIAIAIFIFILVINFGQILYMARRSYNPLTKQNIIIFDRIKFLDKLLPRNIITIKFIFKIAETIIFFQFYNHTLIQLSLLLVITCIQGIITILIKPFTLKQYILLQFGQQLIKFLLIVLHLSIYFCENNQNQNALEILHILEPILQFCYLFIVLFYNLIISFQDLFLYIEKKNQPSLANQNENSPLRNQSFYNMDGKDDPKSLQQSVLKGLNQSQYISENNQDQNISVQYEKKRKLIHLEKSDSVESPDKNLENKDNSVEYIRKQGQQTEIKLDLKYDDSSIDNNSKQNQKRGGNTSKSRKQDFENPISPFGRQQKNPLEIVQQQYSKTQQ